LNANFELAGADGLNAPTRRRLRCHRRPVGLYHSIRVIVRKRTALHGAHADEVRCKNRDCHGHAIIAKGELAAAVPAKGFHVADRLPLGTQASREDQNGDENLDGEPVLSSTETHYTSPHSSGAAPNRPAWCPSSAATILTLPHGVHACWFTYF